MNRLLTGGVAALLMLAGGQALADHRPGHQVPPGIQVQINQGHAVPPGIQRRNMAAQHRPGYGAPHRHQPPQHRSHSRHHHHHYHHHNTTAHRGRTVEHHHHYHYHTPARPAPKVSHRYRDNLPVEYRIARIIHDTQVVLGNR